MPLTAPQQALLDKLEHGVNRPFHEAASGTIDPVSLSIDERTFIAETLRQVWLTPKEQRALKRQRELDEYEAVKRLTRYGVPRGQREEWIQWYFGKSKEALKRFFIRRRHPK